MAHRCLERPPAGLVALPKKSRLVSAWSKKSPDVLNRFDTGRRLWLNYLPSKPLSSRKNISMPKSSFPVRA
jgi:hypothetical protein